MKKVEILFPELCNIYGEYYSVEYLGRCSDQIKIIRTNHRDEPAFVAGSVDMVYLGCTTELKQEQIIGILSQYKDQIKAEIDKGTIFLITGNAIEIFGEEIEDNGRIIPALGLFPFKSKRYMNVARHNSQYIGEFNGMEMLGHRSQFSFSYGDFDDYFIKITKGIGMNPDTDREGIHVNNFFATYSLGPYLILNPYFTKYILRLLGLDDTLCFEKEAIEAFDYRLAEMHRVTW